MLGERDLVFGGGSEKSKWPTYSSPIAARAVGEEGPPDKRALSESSPLRQSAGCYLAQQCSFLCALESSGGTKPTEVWVSYPEILVWGEAGELGVLRSSPGDSEMQRRLRSSDLRQEEGLFSGDVENIGDLLMMCHEFFKGTVEGFLELGRVEGGRSNYDCTQIPWRQKTRSRQWPGPCASCDE